MTAYSLHHAKKPNRVSIEEVEDSDDQEPPSRTHSWVQAESVVYEVQREFLGPESVLGSRHAPFHLQGITAAEMDGFLEVADARSSDLYFQLASAVLVAEYLHFEALRAYAVQELENVLGELDPITCIEDVMKCHDKAWVLRPLSRLCLTKKPFS
ncbi:hypothetical protein FRC04_002167 [Tulasnella sp. 424]|nr:hypothetical protein FRC04_002167 [Tulasnella sp. 424]KAG8967810.1 hypothetical protein FRC05_001906 [Tulasnella sp. 425]